MIKKAASILKADFRVHFRFYELAGKHELDKTHAVCKGCHTKIKHLENITKPRNHVSRFRSEKLTPGAIKKTVDLALPR